MRKLSLDKTPGQEQDPGHLNNQFRYVVEDGLPLNDGGYDTSTQETRPSMNPFRTLVVAVLAALAHFAFNPTALAAQPPLQDLKLWLRADTGVLTNEDGTVHGWTDQGGGIANDGVTQGFSFPILTTNPYFPSGSQPAIYFDGNAGMVLANRDDLQTPSISVYVVGSADTSMASGVFLADLRDPFGFAVGVSDTVPGRARWYTGAPGDNLEPAAADLLSGVPYLVEGTFTGDTKKMFLNGEPVGSTTGKSLNYATWSALAVGCQGVYPHLGEEETGEPADLSKFLVGDISEILTYSTASDAQRLAVEAYLYQKYFSVPTGMPTIAKQPTAQQVNELGAVTFRVHADGTPPLSFQWFKNGVALPNADGPFYTLSSVSRTDAGQYRVRVSNTSGDVTSADATLTVIPDTTAPTLLAADRDLVDPALVTLVFSKPVAAAAATVSTHYAIDNGITIQLAVMGVTPDTVLLTTSPIVYGPAYTLTVNGVTDRVGNTIKANTQRRVTVPDSNAPVPTANLRLWLRADVGVTTNATGVVTAWADRQVGNPPKNGARVGSPTLGQADFANGSHPVITFNGSSGFNLANVADMRMTNMTFYLVASVATINQMRVMLGNYRDVAGYCIGISDTIPGRVKWFTAPPSSMEPEAGQLTESTPVLLTASYTSVGGSKNLYVNSALAGSATGVNLSYVTDTQLTVGYLQGNRQYFVGDIAEILAYSEVSESQRALVEGYLSRKYFGQGTGPVSIVSQPESQTVNELRAVTFEVGFEGALPVRVQWYKNNVVIPDATNSVYTVASASRADQGAEFTVHLSNGLGSAVSRKAILTVILDALPPALVSAKRDFMRDDRVYVVFSKAVATGPATLASHYTLSGGVTVSEAILGPDPGTVILTTSTIAAGHEATLTVNGVTDLVGNAVAANSNVAVGIPSSTARPPTADLMCWMAADVGLSTSDGHTVSDWTDQAGGDTPHNLQSVLGSPQWGFADCFPSGLNPVIRLDGESGIQLAYAETMQSAEVSIYVVGSTEVINASRVFLFNYRDVVGYGLGISDTIEGRVKWFTAPPDSMEPETAQLAVNEPVLLTGTIDVYGDKKLYLGTDPVGAASGVALEYGEGMELTVGYISGNRQYLVGTVAEVLVYSAVSDAQRAAVQEYLIQKYFTAGPGPAPQLSIGLSQGTVTITWTGQGTLQSAPQVTGTWSNVADAENPFTVAPSAVRCFYRLKQ